MAVTIKRGDECPLAVRVELNGQAVDISEVETAEFCLGKRLRKLYPGEVEHDAETGDFLLPLTQEETFALPPGAAPPLDVRVKFTGGDVLGCVRMGAVAVCDVISGEVL